MSRRRFLSTVGSAGAITAAGSVGAATSVDTAVAVGSATTRTGRTEGLLTLVGSYTSTTPPGRGLEFARRDQSGHLEPAGIVEGVPDVSFFSWAPGRTRLYVTNELPTGAVTSIDVTGHRPTALNTRSSGGAGPTHLSVHPDGRYLLTAHYTDGTIAVHRLDEDGSIGEPTDLLRHPGSRPHAHQVLVDPSGRWVVAVDLGADSVFVHGFDPSTGRLFRHQRMTVPPGTGPRHLVFDFERAYLLSELRSTITTLDWDAESGRFTPGSVVSTREPDATGENFPAEIARSRDGRFVYASNRGDDTIATFRVEDDALIRLGTTPTGGSWPRHFVLDPEETSIHVANQRTGTIARLARDPASGTLHRTRDRYDCPSVAALTFRG
ncbi:lactonase family protein [Parasphingorhabdus pacifica]